MKSKICTTIEQSRKLLELGVDVNTADMYYQYVLPKSDKIRYNPIIGSPIEALEWYNKGYTHFGKEPITMDEYCVPCWSLAALLNVLHPIKDHETDLLISKPKDKWQVLYWDATGMQDGEKTLEDNPVDACYEMVVELHEQNLL